MGTINLIWKNSWTDKRTCIKTTEKMMRPSWWGKTMSIRSHLRFTEGMMLDQWLMDFETIFYGSSTPRIQYDTLHIFNIHSFWEFIPKINHMSPSQNPAENLQIRGFQLLTQRFCNLGIYDQTNACFNLSSWIPTFINRMSRTTYLGHRKIRKWVWYRN